MTMQRIIVHWTAGTNSPSEIDKLHYHYLIDGDAVLHKAVPVSYNGIPLHKKYAQHTLHCNTNSIGIALCGMRGAVQVPFDAGDSPIKRGQWNRLIGLVDELRRKHKIAVTPQTILTHAEVQHNLGIKQKGKWDIAILPWDKSYNTAAKVGNLLRAQVQEIHE